MKEEKIFRFLFILSGAFLIILICTIIILRIYDEKYCPQQGVMKREVEELIPIKADKISKYINARETEIVGYPNSRDCGSYYFEQRMINDNHKQVGKMTLCFMIEEVTENGKEPKIFQKIDNDYVEITPAKTEAEIIYGESISRCKFTFTSIEELKAGNYYRIEYGPYTIDFYMAIFKYYVY